MFFSRRARRIFLRARFLFCLPLLGLIFGCSRHEPPADLTIINNVEPESLDPAIIVAQADMRVVSGMFEGLTRLEPVKRRVSCVRKNGLLLAVTAAPISWEKTRLAMDELP